MIAIIDSGATNSNWKFMTADDQSQFFRFPGFNLATNKLNQLDFNIPLQCKEETSRIFFFGAGTGNQVKEQELRAKLQNIFPRVNSITIGSDLYTACLALSQGSRGVVSIIGTGSNCCIFDGRKIEKNVNNLGFILGDEGSGFKMGRSVVQDFFYAKMTKSDHILFDETYRISRNDLIQRVYHAGQSPNTYIASFCEFLAKCSKEYRSQVALRELELFFSRQLSQFEGNSGLIYHFSGSISWHFQEEISDICSKYGYKLGKIIQNPIDSLSYSKLLEFT